jgi:hypothetical protein
MAKTPEERYGMDPNEFLSKEEQRRRAASNLDEPSINLSPTVLMSELVKMGPVNNKAPTRLWSDVVSYGDHQRPGALMATLTPSGSIRINLRKLAVDLEGNHTWALKKVFALADKIDQKERGYLAETGLAYMYHGELEKLDSSSIDAPKNDFKNMETLALKVASVARRNCPEVMHYQGIRKHENNHYQIYFQYRGHGQGGDTPRQSTLEQFDINLVYYPSRGVIRCMGGEIQSPKKGHRWKLMPSEWDEYFMPSQPMEEITNAVVTTFLTY